MLSSRDQSGQSRFPQTRWSLVVGAQGDVEHSPPARLALHELCGLYWRPLYSFIRRSGYQKEDAEDLTQEFLAQVIHKRQLERAEQDKGKLRSFLLAYLKHFLADERKAARAQKRGGDREKVSIDHEDAESRYQAEIADAATPDVLFEKAWALTLLELVLSKLEVDYRKDGKGELFTALKSTLQWAGDESTMAGIASKMGMQEGAVKVAAYRLRQRYRQALRQEVTFTLADGEQVDEEMRYLFQVLGG
ncbi:MAG: hypothetical protein R3F19_10435 [Verrucomicrobiales bacterium]